LVELPALRPGAELVLPEDNLELCDPVRRRMFWCHVPVYPGMWLPAVHAPCVHNEVASLRLRTLGPTPDFVPNDWLAAEFRSLRNLVRKLDVERWSLDRVVATYSGRLRRRYEQARVEIGLGDFSLGRDSKIEAFLKAEKFNPLLKPSKPRMIMARKPKFNLLLASFLKPLEHALWKSIKGRSGRGMVPSRQVGKGLNGYKRAALIARKMEEVGGGCVVFEVDGKSFEAHVSREDLKLEHSIYQAAYAGKSGKHLLDSLLSKQLVLEGKTRNGVEFFREGARASGDFNTGLGNTLVMLCACRAAFRVLEHRFGDMRYDLLADGDNALVFIEAKHAKLVHANFASAVREVSPQELAVENPVTRLEHVVFGQSHPVLVHGRYKMVRDPFKTLSGAFSGYRHYADFAKFGAKVLKQVAIGEMALARGVPVLQAYFAAAVNLLVMAPDLPNPADVLEGRLLEALSSGDWKQPALEVTLESRLSFQEAFGISVEEQVRMEETLPRDIRFPPSRYTGLRRYVWPVIAVEDGPEGGTGSVHDRMFLDHQDRDQ
jgi:hypothetical protein